MGGTLQMSVLCNEYTVCVFLSLVDNHIVSSSPIYVKSHICVFAAPTHSHAQDTKQEADTHENIMGKKTLSLPIQLFSQNITLTLSPL